MVLISVFNRYIHTNRIIQHTYNTLGCMMYDKFKNMCFFGIIHNIEYNLNSWHYYARAKWSVQFIIVAILYYCYVFSCCPTPMGSSLTSLTTLRELWTSCLMRRRQQEQLMISLKQEVSHSIWILCLCTGFSIILTRSANSSSFDLFLATHRVDPALFVCTRKVIAIFLDTSWICIYQLEQVKYWSYQQQTSL